MDALTLQSRIKATIASKGQQLTVTRRHVTQAAAPTTHTAFFLPKPLAIAAATKLELNASEDVSAADPYDFLTDGTADVVIGDKIAWRGMSWRVFHTDPQTLSGITLDLHCYSVRE